MRPIDADAVLCKMESVMDMQDVYLPVHFMEIVIDDMPTIEAESVKQGEWVYGEFDIPHCSECGAEPKEISPYCPNCGAKMDLEK